MIYRFWKRSMDGLEKAEVAAARVGAVITWLHDDDGVQDSLSDLRVNGVSFDARKFDHWVALPKIISGSRFWIEVDEGSAKELSAAMQRRLVQIGLQ